MKNNKGFTLIEVVAVIGVLAVTSAILVVNNRLNELQLSINADVAGITSAVGRAKALTLQGAKTGNCVDGGFGVHLAPEKESLTDPDKYIIFEDIDCNQIYSGDTDAFLSDQGVNNLSSGLRFVTVTSGANYFIKDIFFHSSDARVKLMGVDGNDIKPAGVIIIATESIPTSFMTLKITTTGQVTSRAGAYINPDNFDSGTASILTEGADGSFTEEGTVENGAIGENEGIIGGGLEDEGGSCVPIPCPIPLTCADYNGCGSPCVSCPPGQLCINKACTSCVPSCVGKVCGDDNGCGGKCTACPEGQECEVPSYTCVPGSVPIRIDAIDPPIGEI